MPKVKILPCRSGEIFAKRIVEHLERKYTYSDVLGKVRVREFTNGECNPIIEESVGGNSVYVVQNIDDPNSSRSSQDNFHELLQLTDAARRSIGIYGHVSVLMPNFFKARQHKNKERESLADRLTADQLEDAGAEAVISIDVHNDGIVGCFRDVKFNNLHASKIIIDYLKRELPDFMNYTIENEFGKMIRGLSVAAPDVGSADRAEHYANRLDCELIIGVKSKDEKKSNADRVKEIRLLGDVERRNIILLDDMIDSAKTIVVAARGLKDIGANDIYLVCTHPIFSGPAIERLDKLYGDGIIKGVIGTDSVVRLDKPAWYREVSVAPLFGDVIYRIENQMGVSEA